MIHVKQQPDGTWAVRAAHASEPELFPTFADATAWVRRIRRDLDPSLQKWALSPIRRKTWPEDSI
jgi:hypothetical protein